MPSRVIHQVRCRSPKDSQIYVDVAVVDALSVHTPGGQEVLLFTKAADAQPFIKDETGHDNGKGDKRSCTRVSHMETVKSTDDPNQTFDIEILDAFCVSPPAVGNPNDEKTDNANLQGLVDSGQYGGAQRAFFLPSGSKKIVDKTKLGLDADPQNPSRTGHINLVTEKGSTDDHTDGIEANGDSIPPNFLAWCATFKVDGLGLTSPNGGTIGLILPPTGVDEVDSTKMTTDPDTNEPCPPDNTDPNIYIGWPKDTDSQGTNVGIPEKGPINQGILWYIKKVSPGFNPWFWFAKVQSPKAFSFFGTPGRLGSWGYRGFVLFNFYPVIWILSRNHPLRSMGSFGSPSLDLCAREGNWDKALPPVPSPWMTGFGNGPFGPFGLLSMTHVQLGNPPDKNPYGIDNGGNNLWDGRPNVFQLTGIAQPDRPDLTKPWNPFSNTNKFPTVKKAKQVAQLFASNWNAVCNGHNTFIEAYQPGGGVSNGGPAYAQPPGWAWAIPWYDGFIGHGNPGFPTEGYRASFQNGIPPGVATHSLPLSIYAPATSWSLDVDQLEQKTWDTTHLEYGRNPNNYFLPEVAPPKLWPPRP